MSDMTSTEAAAINKRLDDITSKLDRLDTRMNALPDKGAVYTASLAVHGLIWTAILGTIAVLAAFGAFR